MKSTATSILSALLVTVALAGSSNAGIVVDPGFESTTFSPWSGNFSITTNLTNVHSGKQAAILQANPTNISQNLAGLTAGSNYLLTYWLRNSTTTSGAASFTVSLDNVSIASQSQTASLSYTQYSVVFKANALDLNHANTLKFTGARSAGFFALDDVEVTLISPEPTTMASAVLGTLGLAVAARRRREASAQA